MSIGFKDPTNYPTAFSKMPGESGNDLFYGVELEVETIKEQYFTADECHQDIGQYANIRGEASVPDGFEIVTVPATLEFHKQKIWNDFFDKSGSLLKATNRTGLHIHFSRNAVTDRQLAKCIYFVHETANSPFLSKIAGRPVNANAGWCTQRKKVISVTDDKGIIATETYSRTALSVSGKNHGKTCEMRIFHSNPTKQGVLQALEFMDCLLHYCSVCPDNEKVLHSKEFCNWFTGTRQKEKYIYLYENMLLLGLVERLRGIKMLLSMAS